MTVTRRRALALRPWMTPWLPVAAICAALVVISFAVVHGEDMYVDDLHTMGVLSAAEGFFPKLSTNQAPAYYTLARGWWELTGESMPWLRALSLILMTGTIPIVYLIGRTVHSERAGVFAAFIFILHPLVINHSYHVRPYALYAFFAAVALLFVVLDLKAIRKGDDRRWFRLTPITFLFRVRWAVVGVWAGLLASTFMVVTTHHTGALFPIVVGSIYVLLWWLPRERKGAYLRSLSYLCAGVAVIAAIYAPFIFGNFFEDATTGFWNSRGSLERAFEVFRAIYGGGSWMVYWPTWAVLLTAAAYHLWRSRSWDWGIFLLVGWLGLTPLLQLATWFIFPVFIGRLLIWTLIPLSVALGTGLAVLPRQWRVVMVCIVVVLAGFFVVFGLVSSTRIPWTDVAATVREHHQPGDAVVPCLDHSLMQLVHYLDMGTDDFWTYHPTYDVMLDRSGIRYFNRDTARGIEGTQPNERERNLDIIESVRTMSPAEFAGEYDRAWVVMRRSAGAELVKRCTTVFPGEVVGRWDFRSGAGDFRLKHMSYLGIKGKRTTLALIELRREP